MTRSRLLILVAVAVLVAIFFALDLERYFTLAAMKDQQAAVAAYRDARPVLTALAYVALYIAVTGLSLPGASRIVDALLRRGWLERREDLHDRRMKRVGITPDGREVVDRIETARLAGLEDYAASLTPEQRNRLSSALSDLPHRS